MNEAMDDRIWKMSEANPQRLMLPAAQGVFSDPQHPGYLASPDDSHLERAGSAVEQLADVLNKARRGSPNLRVALHHVINSFADPLLYLFHLEALDEEGNPKDPIGTGDPVHIAIVANQPVELQLEAILGFLGQLIARQQHLSRLRERHESIAHLDAQMLSSDQVSETQVIDRLRYGWRATAEATVAKAEGLGFGLAVEYRPAFAPAADEIRHRLPRLRRVYNEMEDLRHLIDRIVGAIAGGESRVSGSAERMRLSLQQRTTVTGTMRNFAQAMRDALVLGNGYVRFTETEPLGAYNLRPDAAEPLASSSVRDLEAGNELSGVLHFTGFEQPGTPVGLGVCELMLAYLTQRDVIGEAIRNMQRFSATQPEAAGLAAEYTALADRQERDRQDRLAALLGWWSKHVPVPADDLYFEGQSRL